MPKQFCPLLEQETLLQLTLRRVALSIDPAQTLTVVTRSHERFFSPVMTELSDHDPHHNLQQNMMVQPDNRGTAAAIAYAAFRLAEMDPAASVAVFPSDHWFSDDAELMRNVERAFALVSEFQELTVALGVAAERPEAGYGWFELGAPIRQPGGAAIRSAAFLGKTAQPKPRARSGPPARIGTASSWWPRSRRC